MGFFLTIVTGTNLFELVLCVCVSITSKDTSHLFGGIFRLQYEGGVGRQHSLVAPDFGNINDLSALSADDEFAFSPFFGPMINC